MALTGLSLDLFKELYDLKGQKIRFVTKGGMYEGIIDYLSPSHQAVAFKNVFCLKSNQHVGNLRFLLQDFMSYEVVELDELSKYEKWDYVTRILENSYVGSKFKITDLLDDLDEESVESIHYEDEIEDEEFILELPYCLQDKLPYDNVVIDNIDSEFDEAVRYISRQKAIGVSFEGPKISRIGHLSWICISTPLCTFLFDIEILGKSAFDKGLREIFQEKYIMKVIHNCRQPADCLTHLFATDLVNIFDTQVADYIINTQKFTGVVPKYVKSLDSCLRYYLEVPEDYLINREKHYSYKAECNFFHLRPVSNDYRVVLIKNVIYLLLLKEILSEKMLSPFRKAVKIHLGVLADASEPELSLALSPSNEIAPAVLMHGIQTVRFQEINEVYPIHLVCKFNSPKGNNSVQYKECSSDSKNLSKWENSEKQASLWDTFESSCSISNSKPSSVYFVPAGMGC